MAKKKLDNDFKGLFATKLSEILEEKKISTKDFAEMLDASYEHTRKLTGGLAYPSNQMLATICSVLKVDKKELGELALRDRMHKRHGSALDKIVGKSPEMNEFEPIIPRMTKETREIFLQMGKVLLRQQKEAK